MIIIQCKRRKRQQNGRDFLFYDLNGPCGGARGPDRRPFVGLVIVGETVEFAFAFNSDCLLPPDATVSEGLGLGFTLRQYTLQSMPYNRKNSVALPITST